MLRRHAIFLSLLVAPVAIPAQGPSNLGDEMETWLAKTRRTAPGEWGVVVADQSGKVLWSLNAEAPLIPASTVKLLTTGFARTVVGPDARRATRVIGDGAVNPLTGTWEGRWGLELNGDPTLERRDRTGPSLRSLAEQLAAIGVRRLIGPLAVTTAGAQGEARSVFPSAWPARHRGQSYAPLIGPVTLNENLVEFSVLPGAKSGAPAVIAGDAPAGIASLITNTAKTVAGSRNRIRISAKPGGKFLVSGTIGVRAAARRHQSVAADPNAVLEAAWRHATVLAGIDWVQAPSIGAPGFGLRRVLAEVVSQPFDSIAHEVNSRSLNIGAELMLLWGGGPSRAAEQLTQHIRNVTGLTEGIRLVDGSGLSDGDRVAPIVFTTYLANFPQTQNGRNFAQLLPANGSGTLRSLKSGLPAPGVVRAKTGTLGNVSSLVGYLGRSEGTLLIAMIYNGSRTGAARQAQWSLFRTLGANGTVIPAEAEVAVGFGGP
jgi:D-alanyl-D-alanine carboxypeptidase/D-alanyl-D-alanine-endopeptidase (penicillin-binding protein 4)